MMRALPDRFASSLAALGTATALLLVVLLVTVVAVNGLGHFWPDPVVEVEATGGERFYGERLRRLPDGSLLVRISALRRANGAAPLIRVPAGTTVRRADSAVGRFEFVRQGVVFGRLARIVEPDPPPGARLGPWAELRLRLERSRGLQDEIRALERVRLARASRAIERVEQALARETARADGIDPQTWLALRTERQGLLDGYDDATARLRLLRQRAGQEQLELLAADGSRHRLPVVDLVAAHRPGALGPFGRLAAFSGALWRFVSEGPRQGGLAGGIYPALFGTVLLVLLMALLVAPLGVLVAVYLSEYARQGWITRLVRSAIGNLAAVPAIVYGVFGLAFFVYAAGGTIDRLLFADRLPAPTFGTGGMLWASLTLALLTLPVVIVATEEALSRVPRGLREASSALGATRLETIRHTVLPMALPGVLTGLILAMARAAGEVAPLMLVGVVKLARALPVDTEAPFLHLERKFMHLGFHLYDLSLQSPSLALTESAVYATALLLLVTIVALNLLAVTIRNRLREQLKRLEAPL